MAKVVSGSTLQLDNGQTVQAQNGGWYDGQQFWNGSLGNAGVINNPNQQGYGQAVSADVVAQTNPNNVAYLQAKGANPTVNPTPNTPTPNPSASGSGSSNVAGLFGTPSSSSTLDLPSLYDTLTKNAGIPDLQAKNKAIQDQIDQIQKQQADQISYNNENPFLSEGNRVGRQSKIATDAQNAQAPLINEQQAISGEINSATTDINNRLGLATQQYQINDQQHQEALSQFNTLLSSGLLSNLSGSDVATIAASTGLPTSVIQQAIKVSQKAGQNIQMATTTDQNGHAIVHAIDMNTGQIISSTDLGYDGGSASASAPTTQAKADFAMQPQYASKLQAISQEGYNDGHVPPSAWNAALADWVAGGGSTAGFINAFGAYVDQNRGDYATAYNGISKP